MTLASDPCSWLCQLVEWDARATAAAIDSIQSARDHLEHGGTADEAPPVIKATEIAGHIVCARRMWLSRIGVGEPPEELFPPTWPMDRLRTEAGEVAGMWRRFMDGLSIGGSDRVVEYRSTDGRPWVTRLDDIVFHVLTHSHYHRGQIARLVAEAGADAAVTDYVSSVRTAPGLEGRA
jgi:uncharacterized damage-inducible protein DinB